MEIKGICLYKQETNIEDSSKTIVTIINQKYPLTLLEIALGTPIILILTRPNRRTLYVLIFTLSYY